MKLRRLAVLTALLLLCGCAAVRPELPRSGSASGSVTAEGSAIGSEETAPEAEQSTSEPEETPTIEVESAPQAEEAAISSEENPTIVLGDSSQAEDTSIMAEENATVDVGGSTRMEDGNTNPEESAQQAEENTAAPEESDQKTEENKPEAEQAPPARWDEATTFHHSLCFTGDVNLAEGQYTTAALDSDGLKRCVGKRLRRAMRKADVLCVNNEFAYTSRGTPLEGKAFTFRADPGRTAVLQKLGADVAIVANNHVYDYQEEGLVDTLDALEEAGIAAIGAGRNLKEASAVHYVELEGCTVALLAASRVEWSAQTRPATKDGMGVFYTAYDTKRLYKQVKKAKKKADFVVVCMHWGMEGTAELEEYQTQVGDALVEAGADLVVGDHPHQLQGVRFVKEKPVFYSLGNFWFNRREEYTMLLRVTLSGDKYGIREVRTQVLPAWQGGAKVKALRGAEGRAMLEWLCGLPGSNIQADEEGYLREKGE